MEPIAKELYDYVKSCSNSFEVISTSLEEVYNQMLFADGVEGSGFCIKITTKGIVNEKAGGGRLIIDFTVSDGEYSIPCVVHNAEEAYLEGAMEKEEMANFLKILTKSQKQGKRVELKGKFINYGKKRVWLCSKVNIMRV